MDFCDGSLVKTLSSKGRTAKILHAAGCSQVINKTLKKQTKIRNNPHCLLTAKGIN